MSPDQTTQAATRLERASAKYVKFKKDALVIGILFDSRV
jgi:hypothetical protein